jgi:hypothetical protein
MAEQSSTVAGFRALVMLVCLILIPVAAFCGGSFPAVVKAIQSGRWPTLADFRGPLGPPPSPMTEAPRFVPMSAPGSPQATDPKTLGFSGPVPGCFPDSHVEATRSPVVAVNYNAPITSPLPEGTGPSTNAPQNKDLGGGPTGGLSPLPAGAGGLLPVDPSATTEHSGTAVYQGGTVSSSSNNQLNYVLNRLHKLGATYFVLDTYGDEIREFRFYCKMSIGGNPRVTRPFWCSDSDPLKAMSQVLKQVEDWRSGGGS